MMDQTFVQDLLHLALTIPYIRIYKNDIITWCYINTLSLRKKSWIKYNLMDSILTFFRFAIFLKIRQHEDYVHQQIQQLHL